MGHQVLVGNARRLRMIWQSDHKRDPRDAQMLARIARMDPKLLYPIRHRGPRAQADLALIKARDALIKTRTMLINHMRGAVKAIGERLPTCSAPAFHHKAAPALPEILQPALEPLLISIGELTGRIRNYDKQIEQMCEQDYHETEALRAVNGVGPVTALAYVLTMERADRFERSRQAGAFLGLVPRLDQSGEVDKQLRITKAGDEYLRRLLVSCAHYILGPFGKDCHLRRWGLKLAERGGKNAKKRAVVAVARKLAVLLHQLWAGGEPYDPFYEPPRRRRRRVRAVQMTSCGQIHENLTTGLE